MRRFWFSWTQSTAQQVAASRLSLTRSYFSCEKIARRPVTVTSSLMHGGRTHNRCVLVLHACAMTSNVSCCRRIAAGQGHDRQRLDTVNHDVDPDRTPADTWGVMATSPAIQNASSWKPVIQLLLIFYPTAQNRLFGSRRPRWFAKSAIDRCAVHFGLRFRRR